MTRERLEFLKKIANHFRENPSSTEYLGVSRETCFSLLSFHFSPPEEIFDPTAPDFLAKIEKRLGLFWVKRFPFLAPLCLFCPSSPLSPFEKPSRPSAASF